MSVLVALLGTPSRASVLPAYHRAWALMALTGALAGLTGLALGRVRARHVEEAGAGEAAAVGLPLAAEREPS